jgi:hypothetical protein
MVQRQQERDVRFLLPLLYDLTDMQSRLFFAVQTVLRRAADLNPSLVDQDVIDAVQALASTYETASRGVIYEHKPTSLPAQALTMSLRDLLNRLQAETTSARFRESDLAIVLRRVERGARTVTRSGPEGERVFLELLRRMLAATASADDGAPASRDSALVIP